MALADNVRPGHHLWRQAGGGRGSPLRLRSDRLTEIGRPLEGLLGRVQSGNNSHSGFNFDIIYRADPGDYVEVNPSTGVGDRLWSRGSQLRLYIY